MPTDWMDDKLKEKADELAQATQAAGTVAKSSELLQKGAPVAWKALCDALLGHANAWNAKPGVEHVTLERSGGDLVGGTMIGDDHAPGKRLHGSPDFINGVTLWNYTADSTSGSQHLGALQFQFNLLEDGSVCVGASTTATARQVFDQLIEFILA